ncbi:MAG: 6-phosphogluconolactonase [Actinomycetota bacterium]
MTFKITSFSDESWPREAANLLAPLIGSARSFVITGGGTAEMLYPELVRSGVTLAGKQVFFSDERCVPPDDEHSNYGLARRTLLDPAGADAVHRMRGEDPPLQAANAYHDEVLALADGFDLMLLGMGEDNHIAACFPHSPAFNEEERLCLPVDRPDGLKGLTLTPPALLRARRVFIIVTGAGKAEAIDLAVNERKEPFDCPARLFADHADTTFLIDESAAGRL